MDVILIKEYVSKTFGLRLHLDPWNPGLTFLTGSSALLLFDLSIQPNLTQPHPLPPLLGAD